MCVAETNAAEVLKPEDIAVLMHHERRAGRIVGIWRLGRYFINWSMMNADRVTITVAEHGVLVIESTDPDSFVSSWSMAPQFWGKVSELDLKPIPS